VFIYIRGVDSVVGQALYGSNNLHISVGLSHISELALVGATSIIEKM